jgi:hypothetical protein
MAEVKSQMAEVKAPASCRSGCLSTSELSTIAPSHNGTGTGSSSEFSLRGGSQAKEIPWDDLEFGSRIHPCRRYASCTDDIYLLSAFLHLAKVPDVDSTSVKLLLRALKFLRRCSFSVVDICSILAHASAYFQDVFELCGGYMDAAEVGNILVTVMFLAHSYIQDETCPLHVWHQYLFRGYCALKKLSEALMRVMAIRKYVLRLKEEDLRTRFDALAQSITIPPAEYIETLNTFRWQN